VADGAISAGEFAVGLAFLGAVLACAFGGSWLLVRKRAGHLTGVPLLLGAATIALAALVFIHLAPLALGTISRRAVLVCALLFAAAAAAVSRADVPTSSSPPMPEVESKRPSAVLAGAALLVTSAAVAHFWNLERTHEATFQDAMVIHLPVVARWLQTGSAWQLVDLEPLWAFGNYPQSGNVLQLAMVLPFDNDAFVRWLGYPLLALAGLGVYACGHELGAPRSTAALSATTLVVVPTALLSALDRAQVDVLLLATFAIGGLFLLRHARTGQRSELVLAGVALGLALGTKWYGLTSLVVVFGVWAVATWRAGAPIGRLVREGCLLGGIATAVGGFWLVRNLVESGNPLFPQKVAPLGITLFDAPDNSISARFGYSIFHYADDPSVMADSVLPPLWDALRLPGVALGAIAVIAGGIALARRSTPGRGRAAAVLAAGVLLLLAYAITPTSAIGPEGLPFLVQGTARYALPALLAAAAAGAWAVGQGGRLRLPLELVLGAAVVDGLILSFSFGVGGALPYAVALALIAAGAALLWARRERLTRRAVPVMLAGGTGLLLVAGTAVAWRSQQTLNEKRYQQDEAIAWVTVNAPEGHRIAYAGVYGRAKDETDVQAQYPLFGPGFENEVDFLGTRRRELLVPYERGAHFVAALERGRYDLLMLGREDESGAPGREHKWATGAGWRLITQSDRLALYRAPGG
jgi:hypothetical protein